MKNLWLKFKPLVYLLLLGMIAFQFSVSFISAQEETPEPDTPPVEIIEVDEGTTIVIPNSDELTVFGLSEAVFMTIIVAIGLFIFTAFTSFQNNKTWRSAFETGLDRSTDQLTQSPEFFDLTERLFKVVPPKYRYIFNDTLDWFDDAIERAEHEYPKDLLEFLKNASDDDPTTRHLPTD